MNATLLTLSFLLLCATLAAAQPQRKLHQMQRPQHLHPKQQHAAEKPPSPTQQQQQQQDDEMSQTILFAGNRVAGWLYAESFTMDMSSTIDVMGQSTDMTAHMNMESTTQAVDLPQGGQEIHIDIKSVQYSTDLGDLVSVTCDTKATPSDQAEPICQPFYGLLVHVHTVVDDHGNLAAPTDPQDTHFQQSKAVEHFKAESRLLQFIPTHPIKVGDVWASSQDLHDLGHFEGTVQLKGFDNNTPQNNPCAIISITGTLDIDFEAVLDKYDLGQGGMISPQDLKITDSILSAQTCWDNAAKMPTWSKTEMQFVMHMTNPMDPAAPPITMPIQETIHTTCRVVQQMP